MSGERKTEGTVFLLVTGRKVDECKKVQPADAPRRVIRASCGVLTYRYSVVAMKATSGPKHCTHCVQTGFLEVSLPLAACVSKSMLFMFVAHSTSSLSLIFIHWLHYVRNLLSPIQDDATFVGTRMEA